MRPTRFGLQSVAFYGAMGVAYVASPYTNLLFLLLSFLTLTGGFGVWWALRNLRGVGGSIGALEPVVAGSSATVRARVWSSRGTRFHVRVRVELESGQVLSGSVPILKGAGVATLAVPPLERGIHRVKRALVCSSYPLGLLERQRTIEAPGELAAYPGPTAGTEARTGAEVLAEVLGGNTDAAGELQPAGLRDYAEGDDLRRIHWRATARQGHPVVREWEGASGGGLELSIDRRTDGEQLEQALAITSAVARVAREQKEVLALSSQGLQETFGEGHRPWRELLYFLAGAQPVPADGPAPPVVSPSVIKLPLGTGSTRVAGRPATQRATQRATQAAERAAEREGTVG